MKWLNKLLPNTLQFALGITAISGVLFLLGLYSGSIDNTLAYQRHDISSGELWRIVTGNFLHSNHWHLLMNLGGLWVILFLHDMHYTRKDVWMLFAAWCVLEGLGLYLFYPSTIGYVGLSGVLHGLFAYGAIMDIRAEMRTGWLLLIGIIMKVAHEQLYGASADVASMINAPVATESHLIGMVSGFVVAAFILASKQLKK
nr:rhombosortase [Parashewanella tropica]